MDFINTQLMRYRVVVINLFFLETVYTFYLGRSLLVLCLRLIFYMNIRSFDVVKRRPTAAIQEDGNPSGGTRRGPPPSSTAVAGVAPNYEGTASRLGPTGQEPPQQQPSSRRPRARPASSARDEARTEAATAAATAAEEEAENRKSTVMRDVVLTFILALLNHFILPLSVRGWSWYWVGPESARPHREDFVGKHNGVSAEARYHAAVASAFVKDYSTWHGLVVRERFFMDFMAAGESPGSLLYHLYGGNINLPLFLPALDVLVLLLQFIMVKMTFPEDYGLHVEVLPSGPDEDQAREEAVSSGGGAAPVGNEESSHVTASAPPGTELGPARGLGEAPQQHPQQQQPPQREEAEAAATDADRPPPPISLGSSSSRSSDRSAGPITTRRKHHKAKDGAGCVEKPVSTAAEERSSTGNDAAKGYEEDSVFVDFSGKRDGIAGTIASMDEDDGDGLDHVAAEAGGRRGGRTSRTGGFARRLLSSLQWLRQGGGLISGGGGFDGRRPFSQKAQSFPIATQQRQQQQGGRGPSSGRHTSGSSPTLRGPNGATGSGSPCCTWSYVRHMVRSAVSATVQGWSWELVTIDVPADHVPASVEGTCITVNRGGN